MKITKNELKQIIKENVNEILNESNKTSQKLTKSGIKILSVDEDDTYDIYNFQFDKGKETITIDTIIKNLQSLKNNLKDNEYNIVQHVETMRIDIKRNDQ